LRRWLNRFVARVEPTELDERLRRSLEDRYVSVRPDLDGVSFLSACMSSLDAASVDLMLDALAGIAEPGDPRNKQQRRADALVDLLMGRISNGWQPGPGDHGGLDEPIDPVEPAQQCRGVIDGASEAPTQPDGDRAWDADDWDLPASAFRPDPTAEEPEPTEEEGVVGHADAENVPDPDEEPTDTADPEPASRGQGQPPPQVTIGVVISIQSLLGFTDAPGELADGSAHVPAAVIRELAAQPETLFYRLLTDPTGNLLDVTELGRFPSRKLAAAVRYRDAVCSSPICHVAAHRCDLDHVIPHPDGPTAGWNLDPKCRSDHRGKTHAGFTTRLAGGQVTWITPTGHRYNTKTGQLPVDEWPCDSG
jgi:hypothetical protein